MRERKLRMFMLLLKSGFKEIEIGFPRGIPEPISISCAS